MNIKIKEVDGKRDLKTFVKVPFAIFKNNPFWVPPLIRDDMEILNKKKNPAFENAEARLFIAFKDNQPVGRIAAINSLIANKKYNTKNLRFGWFDAIDDYDVAQTLFNSVESWAKELGMETITGPHGFTDLDPEGMLVEGFDQMATIAVYYNHPYYPVFTERYGFKKEIDYVEFKSIVPHNTGLPQRLVDLSEKIKIRSELQILKFKNRKEIIRRADIIFDVLEEAFEEVYGSVPLTREQVKYYIKKYFSFVDKDLIKVVVNKENEIVGFLITLPNLSKAFQKAKGHLLPFGWYHLLKGLKQKEVIDFYLAGVKKKYRGQGADLIMVVEIVQTALNKGFLYSESNPELENNAKVQAQWKYFKPTIHKRRRIYKKTVNK